MIRGLRGLRQSEFLQLILCMLFIRGFCFPPLHELSTLIKGFAVNGNTEEYPADRDGHEGEDEPSMKDVSERRHSESRKGNEHDVVKILTWKARIHYHHPEMWSWSLSSTLFFWLFFAEAFAVKTSDFKTCSQAGFCRRGRALSARAKENKSWKSPYSVDVSTIVTSPHEAAFMARVRSSIYPDIHFGLELKLHGDGVVRVRMDEVGGLKKRYDEASSWALVSEPEISRTVRWTVGKHDARVVYGNKHDIEVVVAFEPLVVSLLRHGKVQVVLNGQGLLHMEHFRVKNTPETSVPADVSEEGSDGDDAVQTVMKVNPNAWFEGDSEDAWWEESFLTWTDSKPKGPESLSLDINFPNHGHVYGIPQHATSLALPTTTGDSATFSDPYRLYNADVFEYLASSSMSLYGSIPLMHAHSTESTVAIFNAVASETWIDIAHSSDKSTETHWISESGILDVFLLPGPTPSDVFAQYARLTGTPAMPAHWALGYHQCRWNYVSSDDVRTVQKRFDEENMPVDVFWLDIEYSEGHKYFIWNEKTFPDPVEMINDVADLGRKMVVIIDPHLKRTSDYPVYQKASDLGVLVRPKSGEGEFEGWCWPGSSSWVDFFNPASWNYWKTLFKTKVLTNEWTWSKSTDSVHIWNDMNEPSVFNGPEITMPKDNIHYGGWEHRDVHNINGMLFSNATFKALEARSDPPKRPFVLTRSFYAGSQRFGAIWTGDNLGTWEHMAVGVQMVLANGIAGMTFSGSDVGGFFGNPEPEMLVRWYQTGAFAPFFRAHAHIDTKRREPFLLEEPYKGIVRDILRLRYALLPVWYTAFREASVSGIPILRPHYVVFPHDKAGFSIGDQYFIGRSGLLVKPVTQKDVSETSVYLAEDQVYYDYFTHYAYRGAARGKNVTIPAALHQIPLLVRGGSIVPTRERPRRSSTLMKNDPFTLRVVLDKTNAARGELYLDDGESFLYRNGHLTWREFIAEKTEKKVLRISSRNLAARYPDAVVDGVILSGVDKTNEFVSSIEGVRVERMIVVGLGTMPKSVKVEGGKELDYQYVSGVSAVEKKEGGASVLTIKDPSVGVVTDWNIIIQM